MIITSKSPYQMEESTLVGGTATTYIGHSLIDRAHDLHLRHRGYTSLNCCELMCDIISIDTTGHSLVVRILAPRRPPKVRNYFKWEGFFSFNLRLYHPCFCKQPLGALCVLHSLPMPSKTSRPLVLCWWRQLRNPRSWLFHGADCPADSGERGQLS